MSWWANWTSVLIVVNEHGEPLQSDQHGRFFWGSRADVFYSHASAETQVERIGGDSIARFLSVLLPPDSDAALVCLRAEAPLPKCGWVVFDEDWKPIIGATEEDADLILTEMRVQAAVEGLTQEFHVISVNLPQKYIAAITKKVEKALILKK